MPLWYKQISGFFSLRKFKALPGISSGVKISCIACGNLFLEKIEGALCVRFKDGGGGWRGTIQGGV